MGLMNRIKHGWNAFVNNRDPTYSNQHIGESSYYRPDRVRFSRGNERTIVTSIYNKIALDVSNIDIRHVKLDKDDRFIDYVKSGLDECLTTEANLDQTGRAFKQDVVMSMFDEGCVVLVPTDTSVSPVSTGSYEIDSMRTGKVTAWYPDKVTIKLYNERTGKKEEVTLPKRMVAIIENPFYAVMNEPNSTLQRLIRKLNLLDAIDEQSGSGKLDLLIQLPYTVKTDLKRQQAETRRQDIEKQLTGSKYGIAYIDSTEHVTQLNRPVENNLMKQIEFLTSTLYGQLGITPSILDGSADEKTMLNYMNRTILPIVTAIVDEMKRKFLTKTARSQKQSIMYFRDPFGLVPVSELAEATDKFTRNEVMTSNEIRQRIGLKPSSDPKADQLINSNISQSAAEVKKTSEVTEETNEGGKDQNGEV